MGRDVAVDMGRHAAVYMGRDLAVDMGRDAAVEMGRDAAVYITLNIFIALKYTVHTRPPLSRVRQSVGLNEDDRPPPAGCGHLGVRMPVRERLNDSYYI
jgi:hypothetical protein